MTDNLLSLYTVKAVIILDTDGKRLLSKYYTNDWPTQESQRAFQTTLHKKTKKLDCTHKAFHTSRALRVGFSVIADLTTSLPTAEILLLDSHTISYKPLADTYIYMIGYHHTNEIFLSSLVSTFIEVLNLLLAPSPPDRHTLLQNLDLLYLALDETIDSGIIYDLDPHEIVSRVTRINWQDGRDANNAAPLSDMALKHTLKIMEQQFGIRL
ncbi:Coatomer subunit zeta-1 [Rhizophlyctis rosea]|uniref:Coatomer subunit zeta n=1 Tax=Rhizophlyctis rosea TaxID=64517 RepID=A0AAD5SAN6_9FUNG|nr:Coatomer subunit zeta-1 [Rhizophlyctis rosea]